VAKGRIPVPIQTVYNQVPQEKCVPKGGRDHQGRAQSCVLVGQAPRTAVQAHVRDATITTDSLLSQAHLGYARRPPRQLLRQSKCVDRFFHNSLRISFLTRYLLQGGMARRLDVDSYCTRRSLKRSIPTAYTRLFRQLATCPPQRRSSTTMI
jgi:hypothetical protein